MKLDTPGKKGVTARGHLKQVEKQTGKKPAELEEEVQVPEGGEFLWDVFWKMRREQAISYKDIAAYKEVTGIALSSWEIEALFRMDRAVTEYFGEQIDGD